MSYSNLMPAQFRSGQGGGAYKSHAMAQMGPQQMGLLQQLLAQNQPGAAQGTGFLSQLAGGDEGAFQQAEAPAYSAFQRMINQIGTRFSGSGNRDSSAYDQAVTGAAGEMSQGLQSQRLGLQLGAIEQLLGQSDRLLGQRPYEQQLIAPRQRNNYLGQILGMTGGALGSAIAGPLGGSIGGGLGGMFGGGGGGAPGGVLPSSGNMPRSNSMGGNTMRNLGGSNNFRSYSIPGNIGGY